MGYIFVDSTTQKNEKIPPLLLESTNYTVADNYLYDFIAYILKLKG